MYLHEQALDELNELLKVAAKEYKINGRKYLYDQIKAIRKCIDSLDVPIVYLENELHENIDLFIDRTRKTTIYEIEGHIKRVGELEVKKKTAVIEGDYDKAARLRDEYNKIPNLILNLVVQLNSFKSGFNVFKGKMVMVTHDDEDMAQVIQMLNL